MIQRELALQGRRLNWLVRVLPYCWISLFCLPNLAAAEEKFLSCVLERLKTTGLVEMDTTDVSKFEEPLIKIDSKGEFWVYVGNQYNEEMFPDGIHSDFVGKPDLP